MVAEILAAVDFAAIAVGIGTICGLVAVVLVAKRGGQMLLSMISGR